MTNTIIMETNLEIAIKYALNNIAEVKNTVVREIHIVNSMSVTAGETYIEMQAEAIYDSIVSSLDAHELALKQHATMFPSLQERYEYVCAQVAAIRDAEKHSYGFKDAEKYSYGFKDYVESIYEFIVELFMKIANMLFKVVDTIATGAVDATRSIGTGIKDTIETFKLKRSIRKSAKEFMSRSV